MTSYLDVKIDLIVDVLGKPINEFTLQEVLEDLRLAYDSARLRRHEGLHVYRNRCTRLIEAASRAKVQVAGHAADFCEALEGVILHDLLRKEGSR